MKIAILALQGAFAEHEQMLHRLGIKTFQIRQLADWQQTKDGLILPGGESTVQAKLLDELGLYAPIQEAISSGLPVFGTCAGLILLSKNIISDSSSIPQTLATMNIETIRNAYGRQLGSFQTTAPMADIGNAIPMTFIRAPYVSKVLSPDTQVLAEVCEHIVAVRQGNQLATAFHPELTDDLRVHSYFLKMVAANKKQSM